MRKTLIATTALMFALSGAAFAQSTTAAPATTGTPGSATGNMNNPGSVKSNSEKMEGGAMNRGDMPATTGTATGGTGSMGTRDSGNTGTMPSTSGAAPAR
ncbi:hypothetical protein [uncultured Methylobacterium sp.]|uniref:hypothetical protein n=1 Tax=uncultured Methylobacterium sp. TaxID=157278 RepID=UPI0035CBFE30